MGRPGACRVTSGMAPYSGSLIRLAFTLAALMAILAAGFVWWERTDAAARPAGLPRADAHQRPPAANGSGRMA